VACWFGRKPAIFRGVAVGLGRGGVAIVHLGAWQRWRRDGLWVPCRRAWRVGLGESPVQRNVMHELRAPSGPMTSTGTVRVSSHGRARVKLFRGIGPGCRG
jgi:hypothetical protein